jgi:hypothetical protein
MGVEMTDGETGCCALCSEYTCSLRGLGLCYLAEECTCCVVYETLSKKTPIGNKYLNYCMSITSCLPLIGGCVPFYMATEEGNSIYRNCIACICCEPCLVAENYDRVSKNASTEGEFPVNKMAF